MQVKDVQLKELLSKIESLHNEKNQINDDTPTGGIN